MRTSNLSVWIIIGWDNSILGHERWRLEHKQMLPDQSKTWSSRKRKRLLKTCGFSSLKPHPIWAPQDENRFLRQHSPAAAWSKRDTMRKIGSSSRGTHAPFTPNLLFRGNLLLSFLVVDPVTMHTLIPYFSALRMEFPLNKSSLPHPDASPFFCPLSLLLSLDMSHLPHSSFLLLFLCLLTT